MAEENIGKLAAKWLKSRAEELTTADRRTREDAQVAAERAEHDLGDRVVEEATYAALPGLREMKERQEAAQSAREQARHQAEVDRVAALPLAGVSIRVTGPVAGDLVGHLPVYAVVESPEPPDPEDEPDPDPYAAQPALRVEVAAPVDRPVDVGGQPFRGWRFEVPGFAGDGVYDLVAIHAYREQIGAYPDYSEEAFSVGHPDESESDLYPYPDGGPSTVTVTDGGRAIDVAMAASGAYGDATITAQIRLAEPPAVV